MIKVFEPQYLDEIMDIWVNTNISAHSFIEQLYWRNAADMVRTLLPSSDLFIYQEENVIKGFVGITDHVYIAGLFISERYQSQGLGRKLLDYCKQQYQHLKLDVFIENDKAFRFYKKNGFAIVERKINPDFNREEYHMAWSAKAPAD